MGFVLTTFFIYEHKVFSLHEGQHDRHWQAPASPY
jgi:hypothetical protein